MQKLQTLGPERREERAHAGDIAARAIEAGDETSLDRIGATYEDDGDR
jgi:hypothetical protein